MSVLRRLLLIPLTIFAAYVLSLMIGGVAFIVMGLACPDELVSEVGLCDASWFWPGLLGIVGLCAGLFAFLVVVFVSAATPGDAVATARWTYAAGLVVAASYWLQTMLWPSFVGAAAGGALGLVYLKSQAARTSLARSVVS